MLVIREYFCKYHLNLEDPATEEAKQEEERARAGAGAGRRDSDGIPRVPGPGAGAEQEGSPGEHALAQNRNGQTSLGNSAELAFFSFFAFRFYYTQPQAQIHALKTPCIYYLYLLHKPTMML